MYLLQLEPSSQLFCNYCCRLRSICCDDLTLIVCGATDKTNTEMLLVTTVTTVTRARDLR